MKSFIRLVYIAALSCIIIPSARAERDIKEAVVKIYTVYNTYDYNQPWQMSGQESGTGSGCIIDGKRILTNAHVVSNRAFIQVRRSGKAKRYTAEVDIVAHECDLAILRINEDSFFSGIDPIEIGGLVKIRDKVAVYGFPDGGDKFCITEGIVSRVEHSNYSHSGANLLTSQIDAAINPGNSGGPVIKDDRIVGVAFQGGSGENIGYMVPAPVIQHFLSDIKDGKYDGIPGLGISWQKLENPDTRLKFDMSGKQTGVLVNKIYPDSPVRGFLKSGDIILSLDGENVENDGTIEFRKDERTSFIYLAQRKYVGDTIRFEILREGKIINMEIKLTALMNHGLLVPRERYDVAPTYYIIGGLVFEPLTQNYLMTWNKWYRRAPKNLLNYFYYEEPTDERREIIILVKVLPDKINIGYHAWKDRVVSRVNGRKISTMKDLVDAFERHEGNYHIIEDERGYKIILDKKKTDEANHRILKKYQINSDRSKDFQS